MPALGLGTSGSDGVSAEEIAELHSWLHEELDRRLAEAETMGVGFEVPIAPKCSEISEELELELELHSQ